MSGLTTRIDASSDVFKLRLHVDHAIMHWESLSPSLSWDEDWSSRKIESTVASKTKLSLQTTRERECVYPAKLLSH